MILILIYYSILLLYGVIVLLIPAIGFIGILGKKKQSNITTEKISIIIPFRNEADQLPQLCHSINQLKHPRDAFEVIFIDDDSSDDSLSLLNKLNDDIDYQLIQNPSHLGKKASLKVGLENAKYDMIFTSDADCILPGKILSSINKTDEFSIGVALKTTERWKFIENMQEVESLMLGGITVGSALIELPMLCSGANLAYPKTLFFDLDPYQDNMDVNSGDDMFFLKAAQKNNVIIRSRWNHPVVTNCEKNWDEYIDQSSRWAGKNGRVGLPQTTLAAWLVLLANIILPLSLITHFSSGWIILFIKFVVDFLFLFLSAVHFERLKAILFAPFVFCFYPIHLIRVAIKIYNNNKH